LLYPFLDKPCEALVREDVSYLKYIKGYLTIELVVDKKEEM
jgi:hypothetical protein